MHSKPPRFSVVIPLYNKEHQVSRAIDSVLGQSFQDFEIVVIDDGSSDGGPDIVANYTDSRIRLFRQINQGVSAARNFGVSKTVSDLVAFLDADDAYSPDFLTNILRMNGEYPQAVAYAMNYEVVEPGGCKIGVSVAREQELLLDPTNFFEVARYGSPVCSSSVTVRKDVFQNVGGFPVGVKLGEDLDTWIRLLFSGPIIFDSRVGAYYYADASIRAMQVNTPPEHYVFFDTCDSWLSKNSGNSKISNDIEEFKNFFKLTYAHYQIKWGDKKLGRLTLLRCRTQIFLLEKTRLLMMSYLPQIAYHALSKVKVLIRNCYHAVFGGSNKKSKD